MPGQIPDRATLEAMVDAWVAARNAAWVRVDWRFGVAAARGTVPSVYPVPVAAAQDHAIGSVSLH